MLRISKIICDRFCKLLIDLYIKVDPFVKDDEEEKEASDGSKDSRPIKKQSE